ncbi:MAG TPA: hypothetical protein PKM09_09520 [Bacillota bacterium]|nr:hypothetical protein [Bacillota bacterium]HOD20611.1 hypothetical protein [Candidatus Fermentibacter daniensis]
MTTAWAVVFIGDDGRREIAADTIRRTRKDSQNAAADPRQMFPPSGADAIWRRLRRSGRVACVRVEVREVEG